MSNTKNAIVDLDNYVLGSYVYTIENHQEQLIIAAAGIADLATKGELNDRHVRIDVPSTDDFMEKADAIAQQIYELIEPAMPYFSPQTIYENTLFATFVGANIEDNPNFEERCGHFIGEYLPAQASIDRTDTIVDAVTEAGNTPIRDDYSNVEWAMFYLESLVALDQRDEDLVGLLPGAKGKKPWDIIDGYRYATKKTYDLDC